MEREKIRDQIIKQIQKLINNNAEIKEEAYLCEDLDIGSLEVFELIAELEDEYGITISSDLVKRFVQVKDIVDFLYEKLSEDKE